MTDASTFSFFSARAFALFAVAILIAPATFMAYTPPARAIDVEVLSDTSTTSLTKLAKEAYSAVKNSITAIATVTSAAKDTALVIERYVLQPLAYITTGNLLKSITASILGFVAGKNGTGRPLYVQNLRGYLQNVGDVEAYSFLNQFQSQSNSPFAYAITSSLRANYLQNTSLAGFFAANKSTLGNYSSNPAGFIAGNWGLGGWAAWFGLTTVDQNNPYTYYYIAQDQLSRQVATAQYTKLQQVNQNQGFLSWCGSSNAGSAGSTAGSLAAGDFNGSGDISAAVAAAGSGNGVTCPDGTVAAGSICGCQNLNGCGTDSSGNPIADNTYVLPTGYSCSGGATFDSTYGGCQAAGLYSPPVDALGTPLFAPNSTDTAAQTNAGTNGTLTPASASSLAASIEGESIFHTTYYGHNCYLAVRQGYCDQGISGMCDASGGSSITQMTNSGFTQIASNADYSTLINQVQPGDAVGLNCNGVSCQHVEVYAPGSCGGTTSWISDTCQKGANAYNGANPNGATYTIMRPPAPRQSITLAAPAASTVSYDPSLLAAAAGAPVGTGGNQPGATVYGTNGSATFYSGAGYGGGDASGATTNTATNVQPGDPCTKPDGTEGTIQTPGSVIATYLNNALKATSLDKLVSGAGDLSTQISGILGNVGTVLNTVNLATSLFSGNAGGILGFSGAGNYTSPFASYLSSPGYLGMTTSSVYANPTTSSVTASDLSSRVAQYQAAWTTIGQTAENASSTLNALAASCAPEAAAAQSALASEVAPVLTQYASAQATIATADQLLAKTAADQNSTTDQSAYTSDLTLAQTTPPSDTDIAQAEADAQATGLATASGGSLNVSGAGATLVDEMNLIATNATALEHSSACATSTPYDPSLYYDTNSGGG